MHFAGDSDSDEPRAVCVSIAVITNLFTTVLLFLIDACAKTCTYKQCLFVSMFTLALLISQVKLNPSLPTYARYICYSILKPSEVVGVSISRAKIA